MRDSNEIEAAERELADRLWYDRHLVLMEEGRSDVQGGEAAAEEIRQELGEDKLGPYSDFEWGELNGKLSALRWGLGQKCDRLDT